MKIACISVWGWGGGGGGGGGLMLEYLTTVYWVIFVVKIFSRMPPIAKIYLANFFW